MLFGYCHQSLVFKTRSAINVANKISFIVPFGFSVGFSLDDSSVNGCRSSRLYFLSADGSEVCFV